jgi:hypothetical protein
MTPVRDPEKFAGCQVVVALVVYIWCGVVVATNEGRRSALADTHLTLGALPAAVVVERSSLTSVVERLSSTSVVVEPARMELSWNSLAEPNLRVLLQ